MPQLLILTEHVICCTDSAAFWHFFTGLASFKPPRLSDAAIAKKLSHIMVVFHLPKGIRTFIGMALPCHYEITSVKAALQHSCYFHSQTWFKMHNAIWLLSRMHFVMVIGKSWAQVLLRASMQSHWNNLHFLYLAPVPQLSWPLQAHPAKHTLIFFTVFEAPPYFHTWGYNQDNSLVS